MKLKFIVFLLMITNVFLFAVEPSGYYNEAAGKTGSALKSALHGIIDDHTKLSYAEVWEALKDVDEDPNNSNNVILIYTRESRDKDASGGSTGDWNREHTWPKSLGFPSESNPAYTDIHHLRPSDISANSARGNKDYDNGGSVVSSAPLCRSDTDSFEPPDEVKGDLARGIFYMALRYEGDKSNETDLEPVENPGATEAGTPNIARLSTLLAWHAADPVSREEQERNDKIYYYYQHNRNPFIDHPEWVEAIWGGGSTGSNWQSSSLSTASPDYPGDYPNNYDNTLTFTRTGASKMRVHFADFQIEQGYDYLYILDGGNNQKGAYTGSKGAFTSAEVTGDTIKIRFVSDYSVTDTGWYIDSLQWTGNNASAPTPTPPPQGRVAIFEDSFSSGSFAPEWTTGGLENWRVRLTTSYAPRDSWHVVLDASTSGTYSTSRLTYNNNLSGYKAINVEFYYKEYGDENHSYDGLYIYNGSWIKVFSFNDGPSAYTKFTVDLSGYANITKIEWQQYDNYSLSSDGICIDNVKITGIRG